MTTIAAVILTAAVLAVVANLAIAWTTRPTTTEYPPKDTHRNEITHQDPHHITHHVRPDPTNRRTLLHRTTCTCGKEIAGTSTHGLMHVVTENMDHIIRQHIPTPPDLPDHHPTVEHLPWSDEYMTELGDRIAKEWTDQFGGKDVRQTIRHAARTRHATLPPLKEPGQPPTPWDPARHHRVQ